MNSNKQLKAKAKVVYKELKKLYPNAKIALNFSNPLELLIATILSAQCTDIKVNEVTALLFKKYRSLDDYLKTTPAQFEKEIKQTGFFRQKAKSIRGALTAIKEKHNKKVPQTMEELVKLPGVGRKTANVVLGNAFGIPGLPVDTHVLRLSKRIGFTEEDKDAEKVEAVLNSIVPKENWTEFSHLLIHHGRNLCKARKPNCTNCPLQKTCFFFNSNK